MSSALGPLLSKNALTGSSHRWRGWALDLRKRDFYKEVFIAMRDCRDELSVP